MCIDTISPPNVSRYVTGSGKNLHLRTKSEFNFIAQDSSYTKDLSIHNVSTVPCDVTVKRMAPLEGTSWGGVQYILNKETACLSRPSNSTKFMISE